MSEAFSFRLKGSNTAEHAPNGNALICKCNNVLLCNMYIAHFNKCRKLPGFSYCRNSKSTIVCYFNITATTRSIHFAFKRHMFTYLVDGVLCVNWLGLLDCVCTRGKHMQVQTHTHTQIHRIISLFKSSPHPWGWSGEILHFSLEKENSLNVQRQRWNANETAEKAIFTRMFPLDIVSYLWVTSALRLRCLCWREDTPDQLMALKSKRGTTVSHDRVRRAGFTLTGKRVQHCDRLEWK